MLAKMRDLTGAVWALNALAYRRVTVGEVARYMRKPKTTVHRHMVKACRMGLVQTNTFLRGKTVCYEFSLTEEGVLFLNSWSEIPF